MIQNDRTRRTLAAQIGGTMRANCLGLMLIVAFGLLTQTNANAIDLAVALKQAANPPSDPAGTSDTIFANGLDNAGTQCLTVDDCSPTGSQCVTSSCDAGMCSQSNVPANSTCTQGAYCSGPSCACTATGTCVLTCSTGGSLCYPAPDQCHTDGLCDGALCSVPPPKPDGTPCNTGSGVGFCTNGVCN